MQCFEELVNIKCLYSTPVKFLSLGQRMLCDIIAAFLHNPSIIYLDEPTIGLDISVKNKIRTIIKELNERKNTTVLLTTHDISDIEVICKRIIIIDKGTIVYDGDIQKINALFGAYRTLKLDVDISENEISNKMYCKFNSLKTASIKKQKDGWISLTFNQDEIPLLEILNFLTTNIQ
jgi:ABC-2 type transport system ATP-binding protein